MAGKKSGKRVTRKAAVSGAPKEIESMVIKGKRSVMKPVLSGDRVIVYDGVLANQLNAKDFGELKNGVLYLSLYEAALLIQNNKLQVHDRGGKAVPFARLVQIGGELNEGFGMKYDVYRDLRVVRGYVTKSGLKFGTDFVVYPRGKTPGKGHSKWMVHVIPEVSKFDFTELTRAARLATSVKKHMLFAVVTERGPVYYEVGRAIM